MGSLASWRGDPALWVTLLVLVSSFGPLVSIWVQQVQLAVQLLFVQYFLVTDTILPPSSVGPAVISLLFASSTPFMPVLNLGWGGKGSLIAKGLPVLTVPPPTW